jgi:hypothetical protein
MSSDEDDDGKKNVSVTRIDKGNNEGTPGRLCDVVNTSQLSLGVMTPTRDSSPCSTMAMSGGKVCTTTPRKAGYLS